MVPWIIVYSDSYLALAWLVHACLNSPDNNRVLCTALHEQHPEACPRPLSVWPSILVMLSGLAALGMASNVTYKPFAKPPILFSGQID